MLDDEVHVGRRLQLLYPWSSQGRGKVTTRMEHNWQLQVIYSRVRFEVAIFFTVDRGGLASPLPPAIVTIEQTEAKRRLFEGRCMIDSLVPYILRCMMGWFSSLVL